VQGDPGPMLTPDEEAPIRERDAQAWEHRQNPSRVEAFSAILDRRELLLEVARTWAALERIRTVTAEWVEPHTTPVEHEELWAEAKRLRAEKAELVEALIRAGSDPSYE
jgi:hypothetical protein